MNEALILLVLVWAVLLIPSALRSRSATSPHVTVGGFERAMDVLRSSPSERPGKVGSRRLLVPEDAGRIVERADAPTAADPRAVQPRPETRTRHEDPAVAARRLWFVRLVAASGVSALLAPVLGGAAWLLALLVVGSTVGYAVLLRRWKLQRDEVRSVVRDLGSVRSQVEQPSMPTAVGADGAAGTVRLRRWDG